MNSPESILELADELDDVLSSAVHVPIGNKIVLDERRCLDLLDQMRVQVPDAIREARRIQSDEERMVAEAREQAAHIIRDANDKAQRMVVEHPLVIEAGRSAASIIEAAQHEASERRREAEKYIADTLANLHRIVELRLAEVQHGLEAMSGS